MDMHGMMSKMMYNKDGQKMPSMKMMQEMCKNMECENIKPLEMCQKIEKSLNELIKINHEILEEIKKSKLG